MLPRVFALFVSTHVAVTLLGGNPILAADTFQWQDNAQAGTCDLSLGDQPVVQYVYTVDSSTPERTADTTKVFHHVYGPGTKTLITKGPGGKFPHHRGLYVGWNKTTFEGQTLDFWHMHKGESQRHVKFQQLDGDENAATMVCEIHWNDTKGQPVIVETRTLGVQKVAVEGGPGYGWQLDWSCSLATQRGEITLDGDRQHAGFQFRAAQAVAEKENATYLRPTGFPEEPAAYQVNDATDRNKYVDVGWLAMTCQIDDQPFTVEYHESTKMPQPARYSERPYGRFGAFFNTIIKPDAPLSLNYRIVVTNSKPASREMIQQRHDEYVK